MQVVWGIHLPRFTPITSEFEALHAQIEQCMLIDQHRLRQRIRGMRDESRHANPGEMPNMVGEVQKSIERRQRRLLNLPKPTFSDELPVSQRRMEIAHAVS